MRFSQREAETGRERLGERERESEGEIRRERANGKGEAGAERSAGMPLHHHGTLSPANRTITIEITVEMQKSKLTYQ